MPKAPAAMRPQGAQTSCYRHLALAGALCLASTPLPASAASLPATIPETSASEGPTTVDPAQSPASQDTVTAEPASIPNPAFRSNAASTSNGVPQGRPRVHLDRLDFPDIPGAEGYKKHLTAFLRKEARRVRWGASGQNRIDYRFEVTELSIRMEADVLRVTCSAVGRLPGRKTARSHLTFGGDPAHRTRVVHQVLEIVARGVLTRLAELERRRRGLE